MRFWDPAEVEAADALAWDMPFADAVRPLSYRTIVQVTLAGGLLLFLGGAVGVFIALSVGDLGAVIRHPVINTVVSWWGVGLSFALVAGLVVLSPAAYRRIFPTGFLFGVLSSNVVVAIGVYGAGPGFGDITAVFFIEAPLFAFYVCRLRWALLSVTVALTGYGLVLLIQDDWPQPLARWVIVATAVGATAFIMGRVAQRAEGLAEAEHDARTELADVNRTLEERVDNQVAEIERLGGLRRFLSSQVADAVLSGDGEDLTSPHRRRIAVFFCDLRGFTAFTNGAEPEEVIEVIDQYYRTVGGLLQEHGATIGSYAGDGVMAYFGDPVPHPDPAAAALRVATALAPAMEDISAEWRRQGFDLSYGIGISHGYATLGVVGFDGRFDYTPLGGVVNLAARLCEKAGPGEVLLDHATYAAADGLLRFEPVELDLKGYTDARAYRVVT